MTLFENSTQTQELALRRTNGSTDVKQTLRRRLRSDMIEAYKIVNDIETVLFEDGQVIEEKRNY